MDPASVTIYGVQAYMAYKLLGPTARYLGTRLQDLTETADKNVGRVIIRATQKVGPEELEKPGEVPPRVLRAVFEQSAFAEDEVMVDYLAGLLASGRSPDGLDDRAVVVAAAISRLSGHALRGHFVLYRGMTEKCDMDRSYGISISQTDVFRISYEDLKKQIHDSALRSKIERDAERLASEDEKYTEVPRAMRSEDYVESLAKRLERLFVHDIATLEAENLVTIIDHEEGSEGQTRTLVFRPTVAGTEIFAFGCGYPDIDFPWGSADVEYHQDLPQSVALQRLSAQS